MKNKLTIAGPGCAEGSCRLPVEKPEGSRCLFQIANRKSQIANGFTLIELLVVISIIALLAAFTVPVLGRVKRTQYINHTKSEMAKLETAIDSYKAAHGFYPPGNPNYPATPSQAMFSPLYFELMGTTNNNGLYQTLDGSASISALSADMNSAFGVGGFINCTKPGAGEDAAVAKSFLSDLNSRQVGQYITNNGIPTTLLLGSVGGPDANYKPLGAADVNPWRYAYPGIKNPSSYDLWIDLCIAGQTNLICNWTKEVQKNTNLP